jgi:hypothetical protein
MIKLRLDASDEEVILIKKAARSQGLSVSGFVRGLFAQNHRAKQKTSQSAARVVRREAEAKHSRAQRAP